MSKLIFGCGYLGQRVAKRWLETGEQVFAVTRSRERGQKLAQAGLTPIVADVTVPESLCQLPPADTVLYAVGYDRTSKVPMRQVYVEGLRSALAALPSRDAKLIYISSTGVYGQFHGQWVDEQSPCEPEREQGRLCLEAERLLKSHAFGSRAIILRLAGVYGPGRIPNAQRIRDHEPIAVADEGWLNLVHVDDATSVVLAVAERATPPEMYLVSDGQPVERREYYSELARLLHAPPPRFAPPDADVPSAQRAASSKRVSNARLQAELAVPFRYPSYREGLAAIVAEESS